VCSPLAAVLFSHLSQVNHDLGEVRARYLHSLRNISLMGPALFVMSALFLPEMLGWFLGPKWEPATPFLHLILGMGAVLAVTFSHTPVFAAIGKPQVNFGVSLLSTALWLVSLLFLPTMGAIFAAILWVGRMGLGIPIQWVYLGRMVGLKGGEYLTQLRPMLGSVTMALMIGSLMAWQGWIDHRHAPVQLIAGMITCGMIFVLTALTQSDLGRERLSRWRA
jgi:O-antigen/teichoic acid export membrane protein